MNERERKAWNIISLMIGSVSAARAMSDRQCAELLSASPWQAMALIE
ncbi:hypothetical protein [Rhizobium giardinii]